MNQIIARLHRMATPTDATPGRSDVGFMTEPVTAERASSKRRFRRVL